MMDCVEQVNATFSRLLYELLPVGSSTFCASQAIVQVELWLVHALIEALIDVDEEVARRSVVLTRLPLKHHLVLDDMLKALHER